MSWKCKFIEYDNDKPLEIGDMFYAPEFSIPAPNALSDSYKRDWSDKRPPIYIMTPGGAWCIDEKPFVGGQYQNGGWVVTGSVPNITTKPSINFPGRYHGWLTDGVLSDDLEGRKYE